MAIITTFVGGDTGIWQVEHIRSAIGKPLEAIKRIDIIESSKIADENSAAVWRLRGAVSYERYVYRTERQQLIAQQPELGRFEATRAALIPIKKSAAWWDLTQDERRRIFEERSHHIATGLKYLPAVARRLYHSRDLDEEFDFLTWFEYSPANAAVFEDLVQTLRRTEEWKYVEREIDIRLIR